MYSLFNEGAEQLYSEEGALVKSHPEKKEVFVAQSLRRLFWYRHN